MTLTIPAVAILALAFSALPADADDDTTIAPSIDWSETFRPSPIVWENTTWGDDKVSRPPALAVLYVSYAALQAYDVYSTTRALALGAREANPLMQSVVGNTPGYIAVKAVAGIATVIGAERLWRKNKAAAIAVMLAANSVSAVAAERPHSRQLPSRAFQALIARPRPNDRRRGTCSIRGHRSGPLRPGVVAADDDPAMRASSAMR